ncbi:hypothetical protein MMMB2_2215 [Mycobacterium marinum MB2]|nr:hypothetical protein MMMB2_2215 [Mycobacterium marinum MB2]
MLAIKLCAHAGVLAALAWENEHCFAGLTCPVVVGGHSWVGLVGG